MGYAVEYIPTYKRKTQKRQRATNARKAFEQKLQNKLIRALPGLEIAWANGAGQSTFSKRSLLRGELATIREADLQYLIAAGYLPRPDSKKVFDARTFIMMTRRFTGKEQDQ